MLIFDQAAFAVTARRPQNRSDISGEIISQSVAPRKPSSLGIKYGMKGPT